MNRQNTISHLLSLLTLVILGFPTLGCDVFPITREAEAPNMIGDIRNILILGNSITIHGPSPKLGWNGNWGMAASAADKDYVHLLEKQIREIQPTAQFTVANIANTFERKFWQFDTTDFADYRNAQADLILLRIGENISDSLAAERSLSKSVEDLVKYLTAKNPSAKVCIVGSFWPKKSVNKILQATCEKHGWLYVSLKGFYEKTTVNTAIRKFDNPGVAKHPSDAGMRAIAGRIWENIKVLFL